MHRKRSSRSSIAKDSAQHNCTATRAPLHGNESTEDTAWVLERVPRTMKCFVAGSEQAAAADKWGTDPILLDAPKPGSGESYDYTIARRVPPGLHVVLAGGLHPGNVGAAILAARPWGVDVASGVEAEPGKKDAKLIAAFVQKAKSIELPPLPNDCEEPSTGPYDWAADTSL